MTRYQFAEKWIKEPNAGKLVLAMEDLDNLIRQETAHAVEKAKGYIHPGWKALTLLGGGVVWTFFIWLNAQSFDGEYNILWQAGGTLAAILFGPDVVRKFKS